MIMSKRELNSLGLAVLAAHFFSINARAQTSEEVAKAVQFIHHGNYAQAESVLELELREHPKDAQEHYLLGYIFTIQKKGDAAKHEYELAFSLDPRGQAGMYARKALDALIVKSGDKTVLGRASLEDSDSDTIDDETAQSSAAAKNLTAQAAEREQFLGNEYNAQKKRIQDDTDDTIDFLQTEMKTKLNEAANIRSNYGRKAQFYDLDAENAAIRHRYENNIDAIRTSADKQLAELQALYQTKAKSIEDTALGIGQSFIRTNRNVRANPLGTGITVRNYETTDEPSGQPVPIRAKGKLLPSLASPRKQDNTQQQLSEP